MSSISTGPNKIICLTRDEIIGKPTNTKVSNLGVIQFQNQYETGLINAIADKAEQLRYAAAEKRHLNLKFIRNAHSLIPEILDLVNIPGRLERLSMLAETELEVYPISVISSIITFQGQNEEEGSIVWHADGIPVTEMVPLRITDLDGGDLELYRGDSEEGLSVVSNGATVADDRVIRISHKENYSIFGQLMRLMHRVSPIKSGTRITLNLNLRSKSKPYVDDNTLCYLAADNPEGSWKDEYIADVFQRQLPKYMEDQTK